MSLFRRSIPFLVSGGLALAIHGCSGNPGDSSYSADDVGSIGIDLQIGSTTLDALTYAITGPADFSETGTIDVAQSTTVSAVLGGLPAGSGYVIGLNGTTSDGTTTCAGSAPFAVAAGSTTSVAIHLVCHEAASNGSISIIGTVNVCPVLDSLSASPGETRVGGTIALSVTAHDSDHGPSALSYQWLASGGTLSSATSPNPTFTCTSAGSASATLIVFDGDDTIGCPAIATLALTCTALP